MSETEQKIIEILRDLKPFERVIVQKDQLGRPEYFLVERSQKIIIKGVGDNS